MTHPAIQRRLPRFLRRYVLHFEAAIDDAVARFASELPPSARVLDAGAGECQYASAFSRQRYVSVDLCVGDSAWNFGKLNAVADLASLPFPDSSFNAALNIVTLEHVREPARALSEMARTLVPGGRLLLVVPHEWEVHQAPHDYFRYTRHGVEYLLGQAGFGDWDIQPAGGYFRLLARRLLNGLQFFPGLLMIPAAVFLVPPALILPLFDSLDRQRNFTLGYICVATKRS
ncbi:MAG: class I SAM-dependent methyltransferase [Acidobacteriota bacterium]|nr:class I SAM-dependent methyltransferase [Acidobacteriota bacterium]